MTDNNGFVVIQRALFDHPVFRDLSEAGVFAWMIAKAAWKPVRVRYKDRIIYLKRGELALSVRDLANAHGRPRMWAHRFLERLETETMIGTRDGTGVKIITICNYSKYQDVPDRAGTGVGTGVGTPPGHHRDTEQTIEPLNHESRKGATLLSDDWKPPPIADLSPKAQECARQWPPGAYAREAEGFANYWRGERRMRKSWPATWANRILDRHDTIMRNSGQRRAVAEPAQTTYEFLDNGRR